MFIFIKKQERANQIARWLRKHSGVQLSKALEITAKMHGYEGWNHFLLRWPDQNGSASRDPDVSRKQFLSVLTEHGVKNPEVIIDLVEPLPGPEEHPKIVITAEDIAKEQAKLDPRTKSAVERLEMRYAEGDLVSVIIEATKITRTNGRHQLPRFFEICRECQRSSPEAALFASNLYVSGVLPDPDGSIAVDLLQYGLTSSDETISNSAHYGLGIAMRKTDVMAAKRHMEAASVAGLSVARFAIACSTESGEHGYRKNPEKALKLYIEAYQIDGHRRAKYEVARILLTEGRVISGFEPERMLQELSQEGMKDALVLLRWTVSKRHLQSMDLRLPSKVVPESGDRPKRVREALQAHFSIPTAICEAITASLYGYARWSALMADASNKSVSPGLQDEDCDVESVKSRHEIQAEMLASYIGMDKFVADICIKLLQPTGRSVRPSLKTLDTEIQRVVLKERLGEDYEAARRMAEMMSFLGDTDTVMKMVYGSVSKPSGF